MCFRARCRVGRFSRATWRGGWPLPACYGNARTRWSPPRAWMNRSRGPTRSPSWSLHLRPLGAETAPGPSRTLAARGCFLAACQEVGEPPSTRAWLNPSPNTAWTRSTLQRAARVVSLPRVRGSVVPGAEPRHPQRPRSRAYVDHSKPIDTREDFHSPAPAARARMSQSPSGRFDRLIAAPTRGWALLELLARPPRRRRPRAAWINQSSTFVYHQTPRLPPTADHPDAYAEKGFVQVQD